MPTFVSMNVLRNILQHKLFLQIVSWLLIVILVFVATIRFDGPLAAILFALVMVIPLILPVYLHAFVFQQFFQTRKFYTYVILALVIVLVFGFINERLFTFFIDGETESYLTLIFSMAGYIGIKYFKIGTKQQFRLHQEEQKRIKAENELLKSQVNPHFLFNTLNSIYSLIIDKNDLAGDAVLKLSGLMRYLLDKSKNKSVSLQEEYEFIENYISLEKLRLDDRCRVNFQVTGDMTGRNIEPMLLIPFIENAFKHGITATAESNFISILLGIQKDWINFTVENPIAPEKTGITKKENKTGIENVKQRLELLYPNQYQLTINRNDRMFKIELQIPV